MKTITEHIKSDAHRTSVVAADPNQKSVDKGFSKAKELRELAFAIAAKVVYWVVTEEVANRKYKSLIHFLQALGLKDALHLRRGGNATYDSPDIFNQLLECISDTSKKQLRAELRNSPFIGIGIDESTDRSQEKHIAVIVRYVSKSGKIVTTFLQCAKIKDGCAATVFQALTDVLKHFEVPYKKVVGLGTDGASVMASDRNGLNGLVKRENPFCIYVHCVCHRLNLAVSQVCKDMPVMKALTKTISAIYNYVQYSKLDQFLDIAAILELDAVKFKRLYEIRWLSMGDSITAIIRNYEALIILISKDAAEDDPVAIGLNKQLSSYKYVALLHLTADILNATNHLQFRDVSFSALHSTVSSCYIDMQL